MTSTAVAPQHALDRPIRGSARYLTARAPFRADIQGLRAVAVIAVVLFHAGVPGFAGGFVGVDVFFVISGFLISDQIIRALVNDERFSFSQFYARRARRILPLASAVLLATAVAAVTLMTPIRALEALRDVVASALMMSNWHLIGLQTDYFAATGNESPLLHYWSLAVEEQFYLVWPALLVVLAIVARRTALSFARTLLAGVVAVSAASFLLAFLWTASDPTLAYLSTVTRAWQFGVGAALALCIPKMQELLASPMGSKASVRAVVGLVLRLVSWVGLILLVWSCTRLTEEGYPGFAALWPTLATAAVMLGGIPLPEGSRLRLGADELLTLRPVRFIGTISFGLYLWHWPVLVFAREYLGPMSWQLQTILMVGAGLLAVITYYLIEDPLRRSQRLVQSWGRSLAVGGLTVILALFAGLLGGSGLIWWQSGSSASAQVAATELGPIGEGSSTLRDGQLVMTPFAATTDFPRSPEECINDFAEMATQPCLLREGSGMRVALFGDSHAHQWSDAVSAAAQQPDWRLEAWLKVFCTPATRTVYANALGRDYTECSEWRENALRRLTDPATKPDVVIVSALNTTGFSDEEVQKNRDGWNVTLDRLRDAGVKVIYIRDTPRPVENVPDCLEANAVPSACDLDRGTALPPDETADRIGAQLESGIALVDLNSALCGALRCPVVRDGIVVYRDDSHLTRSIVVSLADVMSDALLATGLVS